MITSPFKYGTTVSTKAFTNREKEVEKLYHNLTCGINTMIISPRRWGKSSLVEKVILNIKRKSKTHKTVLIDLFSVGSEEQFLELLARETIKASSSKWEDWAESAKGLFKQLIPKISYGIDPATDFSLSFDWSELRNHSDEILALPKTIATKKKIKLVICLDEFQNLSTFPNYIELEKKMRAIWQRQKNVVYCLFGSKRHMMTDIFSNPSKPFYRFGDIMLLPKIEEKKWVKFICQGFNKTGKNIDSTVAAFIPQFMKNHPWYVQQLAHYTWNLTSKNTTEKEIRKALTELISANMPLYQKEVESISVTQLSLLKAIASGETKLTATSTMNNYRLGTPRNVSKNRTVLINNDIISKIDKTYEFLDPAFEIWFRQQYFGSIGQHK
jgi:uncharacterized protein